MKTYQHIIFWILVHASLCLIFGKWFDSYVEAFYYVSLLLPVVMATSYFFSYFLVSPLPFYKKIPALRHLCLLYVRDIAYPRITGQRDFHANDD